MSPRCFQRLPFSTFSLTFFVLTRAFVPQQQQRGRWAWPGGGLSLRSMASSSSHGKLAFKPQKILCGQTKVSPMTALSIPTSRRCSPCLGVCAGPGVRRRLEESRRAEAETFPQNWTSLSKPGVFNKHIPAKGRDRGQQWFCFLQLRLGPFGFAIVCFSVLLLVQQPLGSCFLMQVFPHLPVPFT